MTDDPDYEIQLSEMDALQAIYPEPTEFIFKKLEDGFTGTIFCSLELSQPTFLRLHEQLNFPTNNFGNAPLTRLEYLPKVIVNFKILPGYPTSQPPNVELKFEGDRVPAVLMNSVEERIREIWEEERCEMMFRIVDFLQNDMFEFLGLGQPNEDGNTIIDLSFLHPPSTDIKSLETKLLGYHKHIQKKIFNETLFDCGICFDRFYGTANVLKCILTKVRLKVSFCPDMECRKLATKKKREIEAEGNSLLCMDFDFPVEKEDFESFVGKELCLKFLKIAEHKRYEGRVDVVTVLLRRVRRWS
ncbi:E3 ubiquitin-protein ligase rnf14 [Nowakowskiella sp. JEL0407]|nr:E3 ubiquitin-protein ligase rnf14 [Nowakowskiella sp. JEL0407]